MKPCLFACFLTIVSPMATYTASALSHYNIHDYTRHYSNHKDRNYVVVGFTHDKNSPLYHAHITSESEVNLPNRTLYAMSFLVKPTRQKQLTIQPLNIQPSSDAATINRGFRSDESPSCSVILATKTTDSSIFYWYKGKIATPTTSTARTSSSSSSTTTSY